MRQVIILCFFLFSSISFAADVVIYCHFALSGREAVCEAVQTRLTDVAGLTVEIINTPGLGSSLDSATVFLDFVNGDDSDCSGFYTAPDIARVKTFLDGGGNAHFVGDHSSYQGECTDTKITEFINPSLSDLGPVSLAGSYGSNDCVVGSFLSGEKASLYDTPHSIPAGSSVPVGGPAILDGVADSNILLIDSDDNVAAVVYDETETTGGSRIIVFGDTSVFALAATSEELTNFQDNMFAFLNVEATSSVAVADQVSLYFLMCIEWNTEIFTSPTVDILARGDETEITVALSVEASPGSFQWKLYGFVPGTEVEIVVQNNSEEGTYNIIAEPPSAAISGGCQNAFE